MSKKESKSYILETSFRLFLDKGFNNTSMSDLVTETGMSKGAFYHYFANKEELYREVIDKYFLSYYRETDWKLLENSNSEQIKEHISNFYCSFIPEIIRISQKGVSRYYIMFFEAYDIYPEFKKEVMIFYTRLKSILIETFREENIEKPILQATNTIAHYEGLMFWISVFPDRDIKDLIKGKF